MNSTRVWVLAYRTMVRFFNRGLRHSDRKGLRWLLDLSQRASLNIFPSFAYWKKTSGQGISIPRCWLMAKPAEEREHKRAPVASSLETAVFDERGGGEIRNIVTMKKKRRSQQLVPHRLRVTLTTSSLFLVWAICLFPAPLARKWRNPGHSQDLESPRSITCRNFKPYGPSSFLRLSWGFVASPWGPKSSVCSRLMT